MLDKYKPAANRDSHTPIMQSNKAADLGGLGGYDHFADIERGKRAMEEQEQIENDKEQLERDSSASDFDNIGTIKQREPAVNGELILDRKYNNKDEEYY